MQENEIEKEDQQESQHQHHRRHHHKKSKLKSVVYCVLSFFLSLTLFLFSICMILNFTVFSKDYMISTMDSQGYYSMVKYELQTRMIHLVDASGFKKDFAVNFTNSYDVKKAVDDYIASFYSNDSTLVETTAFKQQLYQAVKQYAKDENIEITPEVENNVIYFINEAANIYVDQISIPFFSVIGRYLYSASSTINILSASLAILTAIIVCIIDFTNQFKHRRYRYTCYGLIGGALTTFTLPTAVLSLNMIPKVNITTHSLYNLFVGYFNTLFYYFYICVAVMVVLAVINFIMYVKYYNKYRSA